MRISLSACKQAQPLLNFPGGLNMEPFLQHRRNRKDTVVIVMGATGTGKSRLSIDIAKCFNAEIINSDKMQVYKGLDVVTNKVTEEECCGVPHHLLGIIDPDEDFSTSDFRHHASRAVESISKKGKLPIIAGGSNSYIKALVNGDDADNEFQSKYKCCFLWVDVSLPVLHSFVTKRVDQMLKTGLLDEAREFFNPNGDYTRGIRRAIGVPEMDEFFRNESNVDDEIKAELLDSAIDRIKVNTYKLAINQLRNIRWLQDQFNWEMHHIDATEAFLKDGIEADEAWERLVTRPCTTIVNQFLYEDDHLVSPVSPPATSVMTVASVIGTATATATALTTATH